MDYFVAPKEEEFDYDVSDNEAKVKVTHLELPFGKHNSKSAEDALSIIKNITQTKQVQLKLQKNEDGGFTISGLPSHLNSVDATKIAKGVASVIKPDGSLLPQNLTNVLKLKDSKSKETKKLPDLSGSKLLHYGTTNKVPKLNTSPSAGSPIKTESKLISASSDKVNSSTFETGVAQSNGQSVNSVNSLNISPVNPLGATSYTSPLEPDIESLSVVGNLANVDDISVEENNLLKQEKIHQQLQTLEQSMQGSFMQPLTDQSKIIPDQKAKKIANIINGDSIGENISDMDENSDLGLELELPASTGTNVGSNTIMNGMNAVMSSKRPDYHSSDGIGHPANLFTNLKEPKIGVALSPTITDEMSINKLNDYDVLNIDLEGLRRMGKQRMPLDKNLLTSKPSEQLLQAGTIGKL